MVLSLGIRRVKTKKDQGLPSSPSPSLARVPRCSFGSFCCLAQFRWYWPGCLAPGQALLMRALHLLIQAAGRESSWPNKNRTFPGTIGKVLFSQRYLLNCYNIGRELWGGHLATTSGSPVWESNRYEGEENQERERQLPNDMPYASGTSCAWRELQNWTS